MINAPIFVVFVEQWVAYFIWNSIYWPLFSFSPCYEQPFWSGALSITIRN
jgi:hypothetical protein